MMFVFPLELQEGDAEPQLKQINGNAFPICLCNA